MDKNWKNRLGVVFSTNPDFNFETEKEIVNETLTPRQQNLYVSLDKKGRNGKSVTLITGFIGTEADITNLGKILKTKCGVGGTVKDNEILIQGDFCTRIIELLTKEGYKVKRKGG